MSTGQISTKPTTFSKEEGSKQPAEAPPGLEHVMITAPQYDDPEYYKGSDKLRDKVALITGGDSGIGRSVSILFAREGANVAIVYLKEEEKDAQDTKELIEKEGRKCLLLPGDIKNSDFCTQVIEKTVKEFSKLDILVNNAATQIVQDDLTKISDEQLEDTFRTNIFSMFYLSRAALKYLPDQTGCIINTGSVTSYKGKDVLLDYSSTKGAITTFTRSLSTNLASRGIRVNCVAPGPIWTPLIPASFPEDKLKEFGKSTPMGRAGQPFEVATAYVYLASKDSSYVTGQTIHVNGGDVVE